MSRRALDLVARPRRGYPDLGVEIDPAPIARPPDTRTPAVRTVVTREPKVRARRQSKQGLKTVKRSVFRNGLSWFLVLAVGSTGTIGVATLVQHGRLAKESVTADAGSAEASLKAAAAALAERDLDEATAQFEAAGTSFASIGNELRDLDGVLRAALTLWPGNPVGSGEALARAGIHLSTAGKALVDTLGRFDGVNVAALAPPGINVPGPTEPGDGTRTLAQALAEAEPSFDTVVSELGATADEFARADLRTLPEDVRARIEPLAAELPAVRDDLEQVRGLFGTLADLAGANGARRFAFVFQNPNELRPTGGFMGQFAILKVDDGRVDRLDLKSIYDAAGQVTTRRAAPEGLNVISDKFDLQDANWFPEFGTSTQALVNFFSETGDPAVDGVVALNPAIVTDLLAIVGPVDLPSVDLRVTEDNFVEQAEYEVPDKDVERNQSFFPDFAQKFFGKILTLEQDRWPELLAALLQAVVRKDLQVHFESPEAQALAVSLGAAGSLPPEGTDGLALVYANIGGGKTDGFIKEERTLDVSIDGDTVRHTLEVTRSDTRTDEFKDRHNRSYVRLYVPAGARLVAAEGFDADIKDLVSYECDDCTPDPLLDASAAGGWEPESNTRTYAENGRAVFANWVTLEAGDSRTFTYVYDVPLSVIAGSNGAIELLAWRQPGTGDVPLHVRASSAAGSLRYVSGAELTDGRAALDLTLDRDRAVGILP